MFSSESKILSATNPRCHTLTSLDTARPKVQVKKKGKHYRQVRESYLINKFHNFYKGLNKKKIVEGRPFNTCHKMLRNISPWVPDSQIKHSMAIVPVCSFQVRSGTPATLVKPWVCDPIWPSRQHPRPPIGCQPWNGHANLLRSHRSIFPAWCPVCWNWLTVMATRTMALSC